VKLALSVPAPPDSRGLTEAGENAVETVDVLLFKGEYFYYRAAGTKPDNDTKPYEIKNFTVKLPEGNNYKVVVLANAGALLDAYPAGALATPGTVTRKALLGSLVQELDAPGHKWTTDFTFIPMWGYQDDLTIGPATDDPAATIALTRAIARVNIAVEDDATLRGKFSLSSARLYNYSRAGSLAPAVETVNANVHGYDAAQWNGTKATAPNLPGVAGLKVTAAPLEYAINGNPGAPVYLYEQEIYTYEAAAGSATTLASNTCLVIGAYYNGALSYYRVDFAKEDGTYLALLRNHGYNVKIVEAIAAGYASAKEAFDNPPSNLVVTITENDGTLGLVAFDEQNYLGASAGEITIRRRAAGHQFTASTDVAAGWEVVGTSATGEFHEGFELAWLTVTSSGLTEGKGDVTFDVTENDTDARRVGYIHLAAGRLRLSVKVVQRFVEVWIEGASELVFEPSLGVFTGQTFQVHWLPAGARVSAASIPRSGYPAFAYDDDPANDAPGDDFSDASGVRDVTFCPAALTAAEIAVNPFAARGSIARFVAFYNDEFDSADIELRQINYHIVPVVKSYYILGGGVHSFTVRSNTGWAVKENSVSDLNGILSPSYTPSLYDQPGGYNTAPGDKAYFELVDDKDQDGKTATLTLIDPAGLAADVNITIKAVACGLGGAAYTKDIGGSQPYMTHAYGTGDDQRCWMVENSREGTAEATSYAKSTDPQYATRGYYYTYAQAITPGNACPSGWSLPTEAEITAANQFSVAQTWWTSNSYKAGCFYTENNTGPRWGHWDGDGYWWNIGSVSDTFDSRSLGATNRGLSGPLDLFWMTVRCVME
jgi:hypothetical protein